MATQDKNKFSKAKVYSIYAFSLIFGIAIIVKIALLMYVEGPELRKRSTKQHIRIEKINALRGNIYSSDNVLLASSYPYFDVRLDLSNKTTSKDTFLKYINPLCDSLVKMFGGNRKQFYRKIMQARNADNRYLLLKRNLRHEQVTRIERFPLLKKSATFSVEKKQKRQNSGLAYRTVGYYNMESKKGVGLELAYNEYLTGTSGERVMERIARGVERPVYNFNTTEPKNGDDIISTIDARIQDIAQSALKECMLENEAQHGTVVLMEVSTGKIISIANYTKSEDGTFREDYNYAIGESVEPGSIYKLASVMAILEGGKYNSSTIVSTGDKQYGDRQMFDSHKEGYGRITLKEAFEKSSNVGISELAEKTFSSNPKFFIDYMAKFGLTKKQGIEIPGEGTPSTNTVGSKTWSKAISIPWMSIGYEVRVTPLQILSLYNAVANNGMLLLPQFVSEIRHGGEVVRGFEPIVLNKEICSKKTLDQIRDMLEGVVQEGTAKSLSKSIYKIAGKTGTAQINYQSRGEQRMQYRASFVGYFPAESPKYSCIVMISNPQKNRQYGGEVAAPVFKTIADKVYATFLKEHVADNGSMVASAGTDTVKMKSIRQIYTIPGQMPNVIGLSARDAVYLLEKQGLKVIVKGYGKVVKQSLEQGSEYANGQIVNLTLN
ncbi:MAG: transpeptidase family protein [Bacteroidales bacterium]|jgi:cell division protein FtsI (penicillin-binding protein 3)|nr:transpeptidase family protein [Bacteroidales bacterium]